MMRRSLSCFLAAVLGLAAQLSAQSTRGLPELLDGATRGLEQAETALAKGDLAQARAYALRTYLDDYEVIEGWYGPGGQYAVAALADVITAAESDFHVLLRSNREKEFQDAVERLQRALPRIADLAASVDVPLYPASKVTVAARDGGSRFEQAKTVEGATLLRELAAAEAAAERGRRAEALHSIEVLYLENFEP
ncbi:MAG TPA: hypothetical protein VK864_09195, partial [Longimicrobiales bacterium]|nr:hypothetical protein [Longimicrobiales bacterium]